MSIEQDGEQMLGLKFIPGDGRECRLCCHGNPQQASLNDVNTPPVPGSENQISISSLIKCICCIQSQ